MAYNQSGDGFGPQEWVTIKGPDVYHFLSDGTCLQLIADDHDAPSCWHADLVDADGTVTPVRDETFPLRAGGLEWCRGWIAKAGLTTVPTTEQQAAPWYQYRKGGEFEQERGRQFRTPAGREKEKSSADAAVVDDIQRAVEMAQAIDMAMKIDAMMRNPEPPPPSREFPPIVVHDDWQALAAAIDAQLPKRETYECPRCKCSFGGSVCPECGGVARKVK